ncbi:MAG TPA: hypothetical protein VFY45_01820, partial [Baekduia sp.]|nr:hypothetical protein [Baekduia sp.]
AFAASLAQLMVKLERPVIELPAWVMVCNRLRCAAGREVGENAAIQALFREHAAIAQFEYGYDRLRAEPCTDAQLAGVVEKRMKDAWEDFAVRWKRDQGSAWGARARRAQPCAAAAACSAWTPRRSRAVRGRRAPNEGGRTAVARKLKVHVVAGVDHSVAGQHSAFELEDIIYLGFVKQFGHAVLMPSSTRTARSSRRRLPARGPGHGLAATGAAQELHRHRRDALANAQSAPPVFDPQTTKGGRMTEQTQERAVAVRRDRAGAPRRRHGRAPALTACASRSW